ncbi:hypothetical protein [Campylobacter sp. RM12647]|uniref:hypothetical protein n=1 Tax=Campylobacter sp. RM12647 TaxID=2735737 RepID=UPI001DA16BCA|nr:hypothetical protein [Campylobacter sp. RM12647]
MRKLAVFILSLNLFAYTLDFPGDKIPFSENPDWKDPTIPKNLYQNDDINYDLQKKLSELDEKKLRKLKKALDILFEDEEELQEEIPQTEPIKIKEPTLDEYIQISISGEKPIKKQKNTYQNNNILINIK